MQSYLHHLSRNSNLQQPENFRQIRDVVNNQDDPDTFESLMWFAPVAPGENYQYFLRQQELEANTNQQAIQN